MQKFFLRFSIIVCVLTGALQPAASTDFSDAEIIRGFNLTVFGSEYSGLGFQAKYIHKFSGPVRFKIHNLAIQNRVPEATSFVQSLNSQIRGINTAVVKSSKANFELFIVDHKDYSRTVAKHIRQGNRVRNSHCMVQSTFSRAGNIKSTAVIVSNSGDALFKRCLIEEVLQGLGPLNDHQSLSKSIFNDKSTHSTFTKFDRYILNMLYDPRIRNGKLQRQVQSVLGEVLADTRRRLR